MALASAHAEVKGLEPFPRGDWPPVAVVHIAFQVMVGLGSVMRLPAMPFSGRAKPSPTGGP